VVDVAVRQDDRIDVLGLDASGREMAPFMASLASALRASIGESVAPAAPAAAKAKNARRFKEEIFNAIIVSSPFLQMARHSFDLSKAASGRKWHFSSFAATQHSGRFWSKADICRRP
jgi:hypothetical protein